VNTELVIDTSDSVSQFIKPEASLVLLTPVKLELLIVSLADLEMEMKDLEGAEMLLKVQLSN